MNALHQTASSPPPLTIILPVREGVQGSLKLCSLHGAQPVNPSSTSSSKLCLLHEGQLGILSRSSRLCSLQETQPGSPSSSSSPASSTYCTSFAHVLKLWVPHKGLPGRHSPSSEASDQTSVASSSSSSSTSSALSAGEDPGDVEQLDALLNCVAFVLSATVQKTMLAKIEEG